MWLPRRASGRGASGTPLLWHTSTWHLSPLLWAELLLWLINVPSCPLSSSRLPVAHILILLLSFSLSPSSLFGRFGPCIDVPGDSSPSCLPPSPCQGTGGTKRDSFLTEPLPNIPVGHHQALAKPSSPMPCLSMEPGAQRGWQLPAKAISRQNMRLMAENFPPGPRDDKIPAVQTQAMLPVWGRQCSGAMLWAPCFTPPSLPCCCHLLFPLCVLPPEGPFPALVAPQIPCAHVESRLQSSALTLLLCLEHRSAGVGLRLIRQC